MTFLAIALLSLVAFCSAEALTISQAALFEKCNTSCAEDLQYRGSSNKTLITICQLWENSNSVIDPAIELGIETLRVDFGATFDFRWVKRILPGGCTDETFLKTSPAAVSLQMIQSENGCSVFMGPGCSGSIEQIRGLITKWNIPLLTTEASTISRAQMAASKLITRMGSNHDAVVYFITRVLERYKWNNIAVVYDNDTNSQGFGKTFETYMLSQQQGASGQGNLDWGSRMLPLSSNLVKEDYRRILKRVNGTARVIIIAAQPAVTQDILLTANDLGMTNGDYVYIVPDIFFTNGQGGSLSWRDLSNTNSSFSKNRMSNFNKGTESANQGMRNAFQSVLIVQLKMPNNPEYIKYQNELKQRSVANYGFQYPENDKVLYSVMGFFDACRLFGLVLSETMRDGKDQYDGLQMTKRMWNRTFHGVGAEIVISPKGDRIFDFYLLGFDFDTGLFVPILEFTAANNSVSSVRKFSWLGGVRFPPPDVPPCGFDGRSGPCREAENSGLPVYATGLIIAGSILLVMISVGLFAWRSYKGRSNNEEWWRIDSSEITQTREANIGSTNSFGTKGSSSVKLSVRFDLNGSTGAGSSVGKTRSSRKTQYIENGLYMDSQVAIKTIIRPVAITDSIVKEMNQLRDLIHDHTLRFVGLCLDSGREAIINEYCQKGSLQDILAKDSVNLDWTFRFSIIHEIIEGLAFLHTTSFKSHGRFKSSNVLIDSRFVCKIGDIGLWSLRNPYPAFLDFESSDEDVKPLLWVAPEHLRNGLPNHGTPKGDVYSFAIVLSEIILRAQPYEEQNINMDTKNIIREVRKGPSEGRTFRPVIPRDACEPLLWNLMNDSWAELPAERPSLESVKTRLRPLVKKHTGNLMDNIIKRMEKYATELEASVNERTAAFIEEKRKAEELLNQILPKVISEKLKRGERIEPETFASVTIYHSDIVAFTALSSSSSAVEVVDLLNDLYILFDSIIEGFDAYKVETIGDAYVVASGLPVRNDNRHAAELSRMSLKILRSMRRFRVRHRPNHHLELRIGLHSGPCAAGVVGLKMPRYCVFGNSVVIAHSLESTSAPMKIHISASTHALLHDATDLITQPNTEILLGQDQEPMKTYWLVGSTE